MSIPEAGARLGMTPRTAYNAAKRGMFPVIHNGSRKYVSVAAFENWLAGAGQFATWPHKRNADGVLSAGVSTTPL